MYLTDLRAILHHEPTRAIEYVLQNQKKDLDGTTRVLEARFSELGLISPVRLVLATGSKAKVEQGNRMVNGSLVKFIVDGLDTQVEESGRTYEENALIKAKSLEGIYRGYPALFLGEDFGVEFTGLRRRDFGIGSYPDDIFPGVLSKRFVRQQEGEEQYKSAKARRLILDKLREKGLTSIGDRKVIQSDTIVLYDPSTKQHYVVDNVIFGHAPLEELGHSIWPYDSIVVPDGEELSLAQWCEERRRDLGLRQWKRVKNIALVVNISNR